ncbi:uncharacterized protein F5Z01DRAFT_644564 [Emericellopsis atlantica]|uniref:Uncharacterized protein n=1 Tax=Emericellopsis atlantica TaxID=2614577 RepID=A0A9P7ZUK5_9HYPO|nr:uncharacterized protein F5Z01DRAFT_644564 [Emericellopsis atlantica]KAG9257913.1 hypothetical protein F5Z01DRAFT_644564 [Emericellopsis atlantica]
MKLRAIRQEPLNMSKGGRAQKIADGMETLQQEGGALTMTFPKGLGWCIESVFVVHMKCYHSRQNNSSLLKVKTTRRLRPFFEDRSQWCSSAVAQVSDVSAAPTEWIEASITSSILECSLEENVQLEFGQAPAWSVTNLETAGAFDDICRPALGMIARMDHVGQRNIYSESASRGSLSTARQGDNAEREGYAYW